MPLFTRALRLVGGLLLLLICVGGLFQTAPHFLAGESIATVAIAAFTSLVLIAFTLIALAMITAGLGRERNRT